MHGVNACDVPEGSLLAEFGGPQDYRDCFYRDVPGEVSLPQFIERFYCSAAFRPERAVLRLLGTPAREADARALARGESDRFGAWKLVERRSANGSGLVAEHGPTGSARAEAKSKTQLAKGHLQGRPQAREGRGKRSEALLHSKDTNTASWFAIEPLQSSSSKAIGQTKTRTRLLFGSWVGNLEQSGWRSLQAAHVWYSKVLLGGVC